PCKLRPLSHIRAERSADFHLLSGERYPPPFRKIAPTFHRSKTQSWRMRMRPPLLIIVLVGFLSVTAIVGTPAYMRGEVFAPASPPSSPPVANNDSYTKHGGGTIGPLLQNDYDPDADPITVTLVTYPTHGTLSGINGNSFNYSLYPVSYLGTDSFTYKA